MAKKKKDKSAQAAETESDRAPTKAEMVEDAKKAIIQEAILLKNRQRSSIVDLDNATERYLKLVGEDEHA